LRPQRALFPNSGPGKPLSDKGPLLSESGQLMVTIDGHFMVAISGHNWSQFGGMIWVKNRKSVTCHVSLNVMHLLKHYM
jgi:hypothetical protein